MPLHCNCDHPATRGTNINVCIRCGGQRFNMIRPQRGDAKSAERRDYRPAYPLAPRIGTMDELSVFVVDQLAVLHLDGLVDHRQCARALRLAMEQPPVTP